MKPQTDRKALEHSLPYQTAATVQRWRDDYAAAGDAPAEQLCEAELTARGIFTAAPIHDQVAKVVSARQVLRTLGVPPAGEWSAAEAIDAVEGGGYHWAAGRWSRP